MLIMVSSLQVETVAQFGVVFLLFALGLEFSMTKVRLVYPVSIFVCLLLFDMGDDEKVH